MAEINQMYQEHKEMKNMRPEDKAMMKQLISDLEKEQTKTTEKKKSRLREVASKLKQGYQQKREIAKEKKMAKLKEKELK